MIKKDLNFNPTYCADSIFDISPQWLKKNNFSIVFCDLDNTLAQSTRICPTPKTKKWIKEIIDAGIDFIVLSNNNYKRVNTFCKGMEIDFFWSAFKPLKIVWKKITKKYDFENKNALMIGDQFFTDILFANRNHISSVLVTSKNKDSKNFFIASFENKMIMKLKKSKSYQEMKIKT